MAISPAGELVPGPAASVLGKPEIPLLWDAVWLDKQLYAAGSEGTGIWQFNHGQAEPIPLGKNDPDIFALVAHRGELLAASGPRGAVWRVDPIKRTATELFRPDSTYIWDLAMTQDDALLVATGLPAKVWRVDLKSGQASAIWSSDEPHVRTLLVTKDGRIIAGTSGSGWVVQLDGKGGAFILFDAQRSEISALAEDERGTLWIGTAGAAGGSSKPVVKSEPGSEPGSTSVTVTAESEGSAGKNDKDKDDRARPTELLAGGGGLAMLAVGEEPETVWSDDKETPLDLAPQPGGGVLMATSGTARLWWFDNDGRKGWYLVRSEAKAISKIARREQQMAVITSNPASAILLGPAPASPSRWISDTIDLGTHATLGRVRVQTDSAHLAQVQAFVRVGNSSEPGVGWSDWTLIGGAATPPGGDGGSPAALPRSRYLQIKIEAAAKSIGEYSIPRLTASFRGTNRPPNIDRLEVLPAGVALRTIAPAQLAAGELPVVPAPRGADIEKALGEANPVWRSRRAFEPGAFTLTWQATDPDADSLHYRLDYCLDRAGRCDDWQPLASDLEASHFSFDSSWLEEGIYRFRLIADDGPANIESERKQAEQISAPSVVDHHPPIFLSAAAERRNDGSVAYSFSVSDPGGRLVRAELAATPGEWRLLVPKDGVDDGTSEDYSGTLSLDPSTTRLELRATDAAGNASTKLIEVTRLSK